METSPTIVEIAKALQKFQETAPTIVKDARANYGKYATLGTMIEAIRAPLAANGLSFSQMPGPDGLTTIIMHTSGEFIKSTSPLQIEKQTAQGQGSAITYMRRYALGAALGLATEDDDDGAQASKPAQDRAAKPAAPVQKSAPSPTPSSPKNGDHEKEQAELASKIRIGQLMTQLTGHEQKGAELVADVKAKTSLDVVPHNFAEIVDRLQVLIEEKQ